MGPRGKILTSLLMIIAVVLAVWQFTSPALIPSVGTKYLSSMQYARCGSWVLLEVSGYGRVFLTFSIANLTYPRTTLPTSYSLIISKVNETTPASYARGLTLKIPALHIQDNYDGSISTAGRHQGTFQTQSKPQLSTTSKPQQTISSDSQ